MELFYKILAKAKTKWEKFITPKRNRVILFTVIVLAFLHLAYTMVAAEQATLLTYFVILAMLDGLYELYHYLFTGKDKMLFGILGKDGKL